MWAEILRRLKEEFTDGLAAEFHDFLAATTRGIIPERRLPPGPRSSSRLPWNPSGSCAAGRDERNESCGKRGTRLARVDRVFCIAGDEYGGRAVFQKSSAPFITPRLEFRGLNDDSRTSCFASSRVDYLYIARLS